MQHGVHWRWGVISHNDVTPTVLKIYFTILFVVPWTFFSFQGADGILIPGGFGDRGTIGKIVAAKYARENNVPYLGICLGMQIAVIEFARHVVNFPDANSTEFDPDTKTPCVIFMPEVIFKLSIHMSTNLKDYMPLVVFAYQNLTLEHMLFPTI